VGRQDLTGQGTETCRRYSWSFKVGARYDRDELDISSPANRRDRAVLACPDHLVPKSALMVERKRGVVREGASDTHHKRRDDTSRELIDVIALCDENVARGEPGRRGLKWSDSQVSFHAGLNGWIRDLRHHRDIPLAVDQIEILVAELG